MGAVFAAVQRKMSRSGSHVFNLPQNSPKNNIEKSFNWVYTSYLVGGEKMHNIQIISDTAHNLPPEIFREIPMIEIPFKVVIGAVELDDNDLSLSDLAALLEQRKSHYPTTAAPPPYDFERVFKATRDHDGILVVTIGSKNSATYKHANLALEMFREETGNKVPIEIVDSCGGTMTQGFLLMEAHEMLKSGASLTEVASSLRRKATGDNLVFALKETTYLYRSGRARRAQHLLASVLRFKPVLGLRDGELDLIDRVRGPQQKAISRVAQEVLKRSGGCIEKLALIGGLGTEEGEKDLLMQLLAGLEQPPKQILHTKICAAMMAHTGPHAVGAAWV